MPGLANDITIGGDGAAWVIGTDRENGGYGIHKWTGTNWVKFAGGAVRIASDNYGTPWVVNDADQIFRYNGQGWDLMPGAAKDIGIGADG